VIYFLFVIGLCVLSLSTTICVMYLSLRASEEPVIPMRPWVCICMDFWMHQKSSWCVTYLFGLAYLLLHYYIDANSPIF